MAARSPFCSLSRVARGLLLSSSHRKPAAPRQQWRSLTSHAAMPPHPNRREMKDERPIEEERIPRFSPDIFFPAEPNSSLDDNIKLISKLGWGATSTVWLVEYMGEKQELGKHWALKMCNSAMQEDEKNREMEMNVYLDSTSPGSMGHSVLATAWASMELESPRGNGDTHMALLFKPLRESLAHFRNRTIIGDCVDQDFIPILKAFLKVILMGLEYMHTKCHVIHGDLKLDNIMMTFEDEAVIEKAIPRLAASTVPLKTLGDYTIYQSNNDFGDLTSLHGILPQIIDFASVQHITTETPQIFPIQAAEYRAPEVILGTGWSYSAEIWNYGLMTWQLLSCSSLFYQDRSQRHSPHQHLANICAVLGDIPPSMLQRQKELSHWRWSPAIQVSDGGPVADNANDLFGGPFFDEDGQFLHPELIPRSLSLESKLPQSIVDSGEADLFLNFMRKTLNWVPENRATAKELLEDEWLNSYKQT